MSQAPPEPKLLKEFLVPTAWRRSGTIDVLGSLDLVPAEEGPDAFVVFGLWDDGSVTWRPLDGEV